MDLQDIRFAGQLHIESYGDNGFRLTNGRHEGSILFVAGRVEDFIVTDPLQLQLDHFQPVLAAHKDIEIMILGTGTSQLFPSVEITKAFLQHNIALEVMDSGAACRTFNILVSEDRRVAAAIIAV